MNKKNTVPRTIRLDPTLNERLTKKSDSTGVSVNSLIAISAEKDLTDISNKELLSEIKALFKSIK